MCEEVRKQKLEDNYQSFIKSIYKSGLPEPEQHRFNNLALQTKYSYNGVKDRTFEIAVTNQLQNWIFLSLMKRHERSQESLTVLKNDMSVLQKDVSELKDAVKDIQENHKTDNVAGVLKSVETKLDALNKKQDSKSERIGRAIGAFLSVIFMKKG